MVLMLPPVQALLSMRSMSLELKKIPFALLTLKLLRRAQSTDAQSHKVNHVSATATADNPDVTAGADSTVNEKYVPRVEKDPLYLANNETLQAGYPFYLCYYNQADPNYFC
jgi:hypothetical protein